MAVETALVAARLGGANFIRSTLNPATFKLEIEKSYPLKDDLRAVVKIDLSSLMKLHDCRLDRLEEPKWPQTAKALQKYIELPANRDAFLQWKRNLLDNFLDGAKTHTAALFKDACEYWAKNQYTPLRQSLPVGFIDVETAWNHEAPMILRLAPHRWKSTTKNLKDEATEFAHFVRGGWLESLVCAEARNLKNWDEVKTNCVATRIGAKAHRTMELDVLAIRGYSLTLFTCTASKSIKDIKLKSFEALHRAQQLGGAEAKAIMVCLADKATLRELADDMETDHGGRPPLKYISREGLKSLNGTLRGIADRHLRALLTS